MVLDASVILKWFMKEDDSNKAMSLKDAHVTGKFSIVVPDIVLYEIGNALRYEPEFTPKEIISCLEELYELNIDILAPLPDILDLVPEIAYHHDITFYDASYVALAKELGLQFVTADLKLYNKVKNLSFVDLLSKLNLSYL